MMKRTASRRRSSRCKVPHQHSTTWEAINCDILWDVIEYLMEEIHNAEGHPDGIHHLIEQLEHPSIR
jgi:hypothetical protein